MKGKNAEKGQSFVEFSLSLVLVMLLLSGLLDLGRVYFTLIALEDAAGEAALYLSLNPQCMYATSGADGICADPNNADYRARNSGGYEVDWTRASINFEIPDSYGVGEPVKVTVVYAYSLLTPVIPKITGVNPMTLTTSASQIIITETLSS